MTTCKVTGRPVHDCDFCQGRACSQHPADADADCDCDDECRHQDVRSRVEDGSDIFDENCAVTAFDMRVRISKDGRERGLWIFLEDESCEEITQKWLDAAVEIACKMMNIDQPDNVKRFRAALTINGELGRFVKGGKVDESALLEWSVIKKLHKCIGDEIEKHEKK